MTPRKIPPLDKKYEKAEALFFHDKLMAKTVLRFVPNWLTPNHFTIARMISIPFVAWLIYTEQYSIGFWTFLLSAFTDVIDGSLARTRDKITKWGKIYDPIADKLLISAMIYFIVFNRIDHLTAYLILTLEVSIVTIGWIRLRLGYKVQANLWGKIKMLLQVLGVSVLLLSVVFDFAALLPLANGTFYLAIAFAVVSLLTYGI